jgi:hypothetical protein
MKEYGVVLELHTSLISAFVRGERSDSGFDSFTPRKTAQAALGRACVSAVNMRKTPCPYQQGNRESLSVQPVAKSLYIVLHITDYYIQAKGVWMWTGISWHTQGSSSEFTYSMEQSPS